MGRREEYRLGDLAERVAGRVEGDPDVRIRGVSTLERAGSGDLAFLTNPKYRTMAERTRADAVLVSPDSGLSGRNLLVATHPYVALAEILELFHPPDALRPGVSPDARIGADVRLGDDVEIGPFAVVDDGAALGDRVRVGAGSWVGRRAEIGSETILYARVSVYPRTRIGRRCLIHAGVVLGGDGYGFATRGGRHRKIPQVGRVVVEDDVEIGANSAVDRGTLEDTVIGEGTKIDDLVMVAHGVRLGRGCLLVSQSGVAGSARLGDRVTVAGQSGISGHLEVGDDSVIAAKSAVFTDLPNGSFVAGIPARDHRAWKRSQAIEKRLPELRSELRALRAKVEALETELGRED